MLLRVVVRGDKIRNYDIARVFVTHVQITLILFSDHKHGGGP